MSDSDFSALLRALGHYPDERPEALEKLTATAAAENAARLFSTWITATDDKKILELALRIGRQDLAASLRRAAVDSKTLAVWYAKLGGTFHRASEQCDRLAALVDPPGAAP